MSRLNERFQRAALIAEAARLEHALDMQLGVTIRAHQAAEDANVTALIERLSARRNQLQHCRELANQLRSEVWQLE